MPKEYYCLKGFRLFPSSLPSSSFAFGFSFSQIAAPIHRRRRGRSVQITFLRAYTVWVEECGGGYTVHLYVHIAQRRTTTTTARTTSSSHRPHSSVAGRLQRTRRKPKQSWLSFGGITRSKWKRFGKITSAKWRLWGSRSRGKTRLGRKLLESPTKSARNSKLRPLNSELKNATSLDNNFEKP